MSRSPAVCDLAGPQHHDRSRAFALLLTLTFGGCVTTDPRYPPPLPPAAAALLQERLQAFDQDRADGLFGPGAVDLADGSHLPYDRYLLVGSELGTDRGEAFASFLHRLQQLGGEYRVLVTRKDGSPSKVVLSSDHRRIVVAVQQW